MVSALPRPLDILFACIITSSIVVAVLAIFLDSVRELAITVGVVLGVLFVTVIPLIFAVRIFQNMSKNLRRI